MFHLDYLSCFLTVLATILLARKSWIGPLIAIVNSLIVCAIGLRTSQLGFIPANLFASAYTRSACGRGLSNRHTQIEIRRDDDFKSYGRWELRDLSEDPERRYAAQWSNSPVASESPNYSGASTGARVFNAGVS